MNNIKKQTIKLLIIFFTIIITIIALVPINKNYKTVSWMKDLNDQTIINEMVIPGTHDSGAMHSIFDVAGKCQDLSIAKQLKIGVRFLDIRLRLKNNELEVVHSFVEQKISFKSVLEDVNSFIENNKTEFIIISIKQDESPINSNLNFDEKVIADLSNYKSILFDASLPKTLGEARGNIYILNRFTNKEIGIPAYSNWLDSTTFDLNSLHIQDNYCVNDFETKKNDILNTFSKRRSFYNINNKIEYSDTKIEELINNCLDLYPSSFNSQDARLILYGFARDKSTKAALPEEPSLQ